MKLSSIRVTAGYIVGVLFLALARPEPRFMIVGLALAAGGELIRLWAAGHIEKTLTLATGGPYAHTRNPLYLGSSLLGLGAAIGACHLVVVAAVLLYFGVFYPVVIREESRFLRDKFGEDYDAWAGAVPAFLPRLTPGGPRRSRFAWARVLRNREWRAALALPLLAGLLYLRSRF
jgi:protein-S-isoprenylcysteine O-methyltransferase Ste14